MITVNKCINDEICENFINYFEVNDNDKATWYQKYLLKLPKFRPELDKEEFYFEGVKLYGFLLTKVKQTQAFEDFLKDMKNHRFWNVFA